MEIIFKILWDESKTNSNDLNRKFSFDFSLKHGNEFVNSPARKLSQSFSLEVVGGKPITTTQV